MTDSNHALILHVRNDLEELPGIADEVTRFLEENEAGPAIVFNVNLVIEELVTNSIKYGYDDALEHTILIELEMLPEKVRIRLEDDGHFFDPFQQPEPDTSLPIEERPIGGLGIHFIRKMTDFQSYERSDDRNVIIIEKKL